MERGWQRRFGLGRQATLSLSSEKRIKALFDSACGGGGQSFAGDSHNGHDRDQRRLQPLDLTKKASRLLSGNAALVEAAIMSVDRIENP